MVKGGVDHRVGLSRAAREAARVLKGAAMDLGASLPKPPRATVRSGKAEHLMPGGDEFGYDPRADEAGRASEKNTHGIPPNCSNGDFAPRFNLLP